MSAVKLGYSSLPFYQEDRPLTKEGGGLGYSSIGDDVISSPSTQLDGKGKETSENELSSQEMMLVETAFDRLHDGAIRRSCCCLCVRSSIFTPRELQQLFGKVVEENDPRIIEKFRRGYFSQLHKIYEQPEKSEIDKTIERLALLYPKVERGFIKGPEILSTPPKSRIIDNLSLSMSYFSPDREPTNAWEAISIIQIYSTVVIVPIVVPPLIETIVSEEGFTFGGHRRLVLTAFVIGTMVLGYLLLKCNNACRPIPNEIKPFQNYNLAAITGKVEPLLGRDQIISQVFMCWESTTSTSRQHPLLIGRAGVGKTAIMMEIARRIEVGQVPRSMIALLKGKRLFGGQASLLLPGNQFESDERLERFLKRIEPIKKNVIIGIDEAHVFLNERYGLLHGETFKSLLDTSYRGLPYLICATTDKEYKKYIAYNPAYARRFMPIWVDPLTKEEVMVVLRQFTNVHYPWFHVSEAILDYTYEQTSELAKKFEHLAQPEVSKAILTRGISYISMQEQPTSKKRLRDKELGLENIYSSALSSPEFGKDTTLSDNIKKLTQDIDRLRKESDEQVEKLAKFKRTSEEIAQLKYEIILLAHKLNEVVLNNSTKSFLSKRCSKNRREYEENSRKFLFYNYYLLRAMLARKEDYHITDLNKKVIFKLIDEYQTSLDKAYSGKKAGSLQNRTSFRGKRSISDPADPLRGEDFAVIMRKKVDSGDKSNDKKKNDA